MSRLFPHTPYAEDQPLSRTILTTHVLTRGIQSGALLGSLISCDLYILPRAARYFYILPSLQKRIPTSSFPRLLLRSTGVGAVIGTGIVGLGLVGRMWGREEIEWKDRSWRLLENKGQLECDDWTYPGMVAGLVGVLSSRTGRAMGWRGAVGGLGAGSVLGLMGYMGWRYGVKGGKFEEQS